MKPKVAYLCYRLLMPVSWVWALKLRRPVIFAMLGRRVKKLFVYNDVTIHNFRNLTIGNHVSIQQGSLLSCKGGLTIGDYVAIGHGTSIVTTEHSYDDPATPIKYQPIQLKPVTIHDNVWIGANVTILAGVSVATGTVIAAGAVVTRSVDTPDTIVGGVPAKFLKNRLADGRDRARAAEKPD